MAVIKVDENDPIGELEPSFPFRDVKIMHNVDCRDYYDLKEEIGRGKFGTVYRCVEKKTGIVLAAKFVAIAKKQDRINVEREVEIMRTLQHPRLIQLYDSFEIHNVMCVILELIEGGELFERVIDDDFILTEKACSIFMRQICEGVSFIHSNNIIHLDLKPENILCLSKTGNRIKIIDFGLARKYDPNKKLQVLFGTPEFVAPEVVNFDEITTATDMWSVGVICYVLLSGLSPFMGENDLQTMTNVTMAQYDFDDEAFDCISADAKDFISKLLVKDKEKRLSSGSCLKHLWLKRKPPPPPMSLETSKENLKTYVDHSHSSSPFLISDSLSSNSINANQLIISSESFENDKNLLNSTTEITLDPKDSLILIPEKENSKIDLEMETSLNSHDKQEITGDRNSNPLPAPENVKSISNDSFNRKVLLKTDSFKELPRKFSVSLSGGSRELPRRSSLTRADKAKNEIKRETFVTFIGPKEIKPVDVLSPEVKTVVEELTKFIKSNIEEAVDHSSVQSRKEVTSESFLVNDSKQTLNKKKEHFSTNEEETSKKIIEVAPSKSQNLGGETESLNKYFSQTKKTNETETLSQNYINIYKAPGQLDRNYETASFKRPADFLKASNKPKDVIDVTKGIAGCKTFKSSQITDKYSSSLESKSSGYCHSILSTHSKEISYSKSTNISNSDPKEMYSSLRVQSLCKGQNNLLDKDRKEALYSCSADSVETAQSTFKLRKENDKKELNSAATRNVPTLPPITNQNIKHFEPVIDKKENIINSRINKTSYSRATSLDPTSADSLTIESIDPPFQSRFLRSSLLKCDSNNRCSSEEPVNKYDDFKNRYSNYKELAMGNDKLFKKSFLDRTTPKKRDSTAEATSHSNSANNSGENTSSNPIALTSHSYSTLGTLSSSSFTSRQKLKLTEQPRDFYSPSTRSNHSDSSSNISRAEKESYSSNKSGFIGATSSKHLHSSSYSSNSVSKISISDKCPNNVSKK